MLISAPNHFDEIAEQQYQREGEEQLHQVVTSVEVPQQEPRDDQRQQGEDDGGCNHAQPERGGRILAMTHNMRSLNLRYYDKVKEEWLDEWDSESIDQMNRVPDAFELRMELEDDEARTASFFTRITAKP